MFMIYKNYIGRLVRLDFGITLWTLPDSLDVKINFQNSKSDIAMIVATQKNHFFIFTNHNEFGWVDNCVCGSFL